MGGSGVAGRPFVSGWSRMLVSSSENATLSRTHVPVGVEAVLNSHARMVTIDEDSATNEGVGINAIGTVGNSSVRRQ